MEQSQYDLFDSAKQIPEPPAMLAKPEPKSATMRAIESLSRLSRSEDRHRLATEMTKRLNENRGIERLINEAESLQENPYGIKR